MGTHKICFNIIYAFLFGYINGQFSIYSVHFWGRAVTNIVGQPLALFCNMIKPNIFGLDTTLSGSSFNQSLIQNHLI